MIDIKDISGNILLSVPILEDSEHVEELMKSDYVQLIWHSDSNDILPVGCYIEYKNERFSLLEPYEPVQENEIEFVYTPQFQSVIMAWGKIPFFHYVENTDGNIPIKEPDWTLTDNPGNFMSAIIKAIKNETGEVWTYTVDASLAASTSLSFQSRDIFSALNDIAGSFETEWWVDKENKIIHLSKASYGEQTILSVGDNIQVPSVTKSKEGYYTRFYAFGSTRNIDQDYKGSSVNSIVNKRLTLDPAKYPGGYKDIKEDLKPGEIFPKVLIFDDIYPSSRLTIADVRTRLMWRLDDNGKKIQVGTDDDGTPIYDQYAIWYFQIPGYTFEPDDIIEGLNLSVNFQTGPLAGREFELTYHAVDENISSTDGLSFNIKAGDFEIGFIEEGNYIIPSMTGLIPVDGNEIILFNIKMPSEYTESAYKELETALDEEIVRQSSDLNNYQFASNPVAFYTLNPNLSVGRSVIYVNGDYRYSTRVIKLVTKVDYECEQTITIGNELIKGNTQEIKEEVASANQNINLLAVFNDMTSNLQQAYQRTQKMMLDGFARINRMWQFDPSYPDTIFTEYNVWTKGFLSSKGRNPGSDGSGGTGGSSTLGTLNNVGSWADEVPAVDRIMVQLAGATHWTSKPLSEVVGLDTKALAEYLTENEYAKKGDIPSLAGYATELWVTSKGYATSAELRSVSDRLDDFLTGTDTDSVINKWKELEAFLTGFTETDTLAGALSGKADKGVSIIAGAGLTGGGTLSASRTLSLAASGVKAGTYAKVTVDAYGRVTSGTSLAAADVPELSISKVSGLQDALDKKVDTAFFARMFGLMNAGGNEIAVNDVNTVADSIKAKLGLWTEEYLSSKGKNPDVGGGGAVGIDETELWKILGSTGTEQISGTHLTMALSGYLKGFTVKLGTVAYNSVNGVVELPAYPTVTALEWANITGKPSTLSGYGITDAKIAGGVITLGGSSITPLTSHQSLADYYKKSEVDAKLADGSVTKLGTATVGSLTNAVYLNGGVPMACSPMALRGSLTSDMDLDTVNTNGIYTNGANANATSANHYPMAQAGALFVGQAAYSSANQIYGLFSANRWFVRGGGGSVTTKTAWKEIVTKEGSVGSAVGSSVRPTYVSSVGVITACSYSFGNASGNAALNNGTLNSNLNADMLDGEHGDWYQKNVLKFRTFTGENVAGGIDVNTLAPQGGIIRNYNSYGYWKNAPTGLQYGAVLTLCSSPDSIALSGQFAWDINHNSEDSTRSLWFRASNNLGWKNDWKQIAFTTSNVSSATKLQTARTLWGQSFDGTTNVSGSMTGVGTIKSGGGDYGNYILYRGLAEGESLRIDSLDVNGTWLHNGITLGTNGNVIIGGVGATSYKLDVKGTFRTSSAATLLSTLSVAGRATFSNGVVIGDALLMWDSSNGGLYVVNKDGKTAAGFYATGYLSSKGMNNADGGGGSSGASYDRLDAWAGYTTSKAGYVLSAGLGYGLYTTQNSLLSRVGALEGKNYLDALVLTTTGSGNAVTSVALSADKKTLTVTKGTTFLTSHQALDYLVVKDVRGSERLPDYFTVCRASFWFNNAGTPSSNWYSGLHVKGWTDSYASWQICANSSSSASANNHLYFRSGINSIWNGWKELAFVTDNVASATKLQTARTINGASFNGTANITFGRLFPIDIAANTDMNTLTGPGMYTCGATAIAGTLSNSPTTLAFSLLVEYHAGVKQTVTEYTIANPRTWFRNYYNGTWGSWYLIPTGASYASLLDGRYLQLTGGTMTGTLNKKTATLTRAVLLSVDDYLVFGDVQGNTFIRGASVRFQNVVGTSCVDVSGGAMTITNAAYNKTLTLKATGTTAKNQGSGILFYSIDGTQNIALRHEWYDTFVPGYGLAISKDTALEAGDANMFLYNTGRYISKVPTGTKPIDVVSTTLCTNLNADLLDGEHLSSIVPCRCYNCTNGFLVKIHASASSDFMMVVRITGNSYSTNVPFDTTVQFYNYNSGNSIVNGTAVNNGASFGNIQAFNYGGYIYIWFKQPRNYCSFIIRAYRGNISSETQCTVTNAALPTSGVTRSIAITPSNSALTTDNVASATVASKLGTDTVGGTAKPIYLNAGTATALSATVGSTSKPVYMNAGTVTALSATVGSATRPVYMNAGTITAGTYTFGNASGNAPVSNGTLCSNLNADLLDGYHRSNLFNGVDVWLSETTNLTRSITVAGDANTYYPVVLSVSSSKRLPTKISVWKNLGSTTASYTGNHSNGTSSMWLLYEGRNTTWDGNGGFYRTLYRAMPYANLCAKADYNNNIHGGLVVWLRGGGTQYYITCTNAFSATVYLSQTTVATQGSYTFEVAPVTTLGNLGIISDSLRLYGNASTATTLATSRTIWGQNFNGSADVSGAMTGVTSITMNGTLHGVTSARLSSTLFFKEASTTQGIYFSPGADGSLGIYAHNNYNWATNNMKILYNGNIGIGTITPAYKLDVAGAIRASSWLRTTGSVGWYNETYNGGWYMTDTSWVRSYNNKAIYNGGGLAIGPSGFVVGAHFHGENHSSVEVSGGDYTMGLGCHRDGKWYWWRGTSTPTASTSKSYVMTYDGTTWAFTGVLKTTVGIYSDGYMSSKGQNTSSDMRLKIKVRDVALGVREIAAAPSFEYRWKDGTPGIEAGSSAQYWESVLPSFVKTRSGYKEMGYGNIALLSAISLAKVLLDVDRRTETLEEKVRRLERENEELRAFKRMVERRLSA